MYIGEAMSGRGEKDLNENVGGLDRFVRVVGGMFLLGLSMFKLTGNLHLILGFIGIYGIITGTLRICVINHIFKINTSRKLK